MFTRFDASKSTKGASKMRRDLINAEIANLRDLLPLPPSTRQRLSQLQLMALVCVYVRKANYFQQIFKQRHDIVSSHCYPAQTFGFSKALSGFLMMMTQHGKLLYISDNAAEYLGHSMEDLLIHGDSVYDMIDKQDHQNVQTELVKSIPTHGEDARIFLCRMNVSRNARRQMRFGDQKVILVQGHFLSYLPLCSRNEPVFLATCTPVAMPETRECVVQGATNVFTSIHSMDMKFIHIDRNGEFHLGFPRAELQGISWYQLLHWNSMAEAQNKHRLVTQSEQDRSCILLVQMQRRNGNWMWIHCVLQVKENMENSQQPIIVSTNQVLSEKEAAVLRANSWLYNYYTVQSKLQYGFSYADQQTGVRRTSSPTQAFYHRTEAPPPPPSTAVPAFSSEHHHRFEVGTGGNLYPHPHNQHFPHTPLDRHRYVRMATESEPVDYSLHSSQEDMDMEVRHHHQYHQGRLFGKHDAQGVKSVSPCSETVVDEGGGEGVLLSAISSLGRSRALMKAATNVVDPADFMDQWNPSPPWSDTTMQKVPDILHQDLSPNVTNTPPTPGSNSSTQQAYPPAFTFDWTPEQYVPNIQPRTCAVPSISPSPGEEYPYLLPSFAWSTEHRLFPLQPPPTTRPKTPLVVKIESIAAARHVKSKKKK